MPVYIYEEDAFDKMVLVEGEDYRRLGCKTKEVFDVCSFDAFLDLWEKNCQERKGLRPRIFLSVEVKPFSAKSGTGMNASIYGFWGWNRYLVADNGEIVFQENFARGPIDIEKAQEAGFRLFKEATKDFDR